jgi:hypothetical protein
VSFGLTALSSSIYTIGILSLARERSYVIFTGRPPAQVRARAHRKCLMDTSRQIVELFDGFVYVQGETAIKLLLLMDQEDSLEAMKTCPVVVVS